MIFESSPWKASLIRDAGLISRWAIKPPSARRSFLIEKKLFLSAYSLRKLSDDHKLSSATLSAAVSVKIAPALKKGFSKIRHWPDRYFDMENTVSSTMAWRRVLNLLIHSTVFLEDLGDDGHYGGFWVTSDQEQRRGLIRVDLADIVTLISRAAGDYPSAIRHTWISSENRWITWTGHGPIDVEETA
ncbi:hypothetical protein PFY01_02050 [Brevundimonas vesicularis]|uniref:hypothetical protein n=1 Tax=Brevundimonas vesicularis TaxID=41276 RepID=UPI0022EC217D|nr:hypothetical protein [Brevundimonas vesicularis]WBT06484.1 hypothetical protein PFY01_02050 [Brevundimonas vesicularis]